MNPREAKYLGWLLRMLVEIETFILTYSTVTQLWSLRYYKHPLIAD